MNTDASLYDDEAVDIVEADDDIEGADLGELGAIATHWHNKAMGHYGHAVECAWHSGRALLAAKERCIHGTWLPWLEANFAGSQATAKRYMQLASNRSCVSDLEPGQSINSALASISRNDNPKPKPSGPQKKATAAEQVKSLKSLMAEREQRIEDYREELAQRDEVIEKQDEVIALLKADLAERDQTIASLRQQLAATERSTTAKLPAARPKESRHERLLRVVVTKLTENGPMSTPALRDKLTGADDRSAVYEVLEKASADGLITGIGTTKRNSVIWSLAPSAVEASR